MVDLKFTASVVEPARLLNQHVIVRCNDCAYARDCGYMDVTAARLAELHNERFGHHTVMTSEPAEPLTQRMIMKKMQKRDRPGRAIVDLPGL